MSITRNYSSVMTRDSISVDFPCPGEPLSINAVGSGWQKRYRHGQPWKDMATVLFRANPLPWRRPQAILVDVTLPFRKASRRDPHNYVGTTVKAIVDGLVVAGVIPDDTSEWATIVDPTLVIQRTTTATPLIATITLTLRDNLS